MSIIDASAHSDPRFTGTEPAIKEHRYTGGNLRRFTIIHRDFLLVVRAVREGRLDPEQEAIAFARFYDEL